jgi:hypothetical protein
MRNVDSAVLAALAQRVLIARSFISIEAKEFETGAPAIARFWNDIGNVIAPVVDPETLEPVEHTFVGSGSLIRVDPIPLVADLTVRKVTATLNQTNDIINDYVRGYDLKGAKVQIHRGLFSPANRGIVTAAEIRFVGEIDEVTINTPAVGQPGSISVTMVSTTRELTRTNSAKRSDEDQQQRAPGDRFFKYAGVAGEWEIFWGQASGKAPSITVGSGNPAADWARLHGLR